MQMGLSEDHVAHRWAREASAALRRAISDLRMEWAWRQHLCRRFSQLPLPAISTQHGGDRVFPNHGT